MQEPFGASLLSRRRHGHCFVEGVSLSVTMSTSSTFPNTSLQSLFDDPVDNPVPVQRKRKIVLPELETVQTAPPIELGFRSFASFNRPASTAPLSRTTASKPVPVAVVREEVVAATAPVPSEPVLAIWPEVDPDDGLDLSFGFPLDPADDAFSRARTTTTHSLSL